MNMNMQESESEKEKEKAKEGKGKNSARYEVPAPFPQRLLPPSKERYQHEIHEIFKQVKLTSLCLMPLIKLMRMPSSLKSYAL